MVKNHLKKIAAPRTWHLKRKKNTFITRPNPGAHPLDMGMALTNVMRQMLKVAKTAKEVKSIVNNKEVLVDKRKRKDARMIVGFMDVIEFPETGSAFRIVLDRKGRLSATDVEKAEAGSKLIRIEGKSLIKKGKVQLHMSDGRNILADDKKMNVGDTLHVELPSQKVLAHFPLDKKVSAVLIGGKHSGTVGTVDEINQNKILFSTSEGNKYETLKKYAFVVGKDKPAQKSISGLNK